MILNDQPLQPGDIVKVNPTKIAITAPNQNLVLALAFINDDTSPDIKVMILIDLDKIENIRTVLDEAEMRIKRQLENA